MAVRKPCRSRGCKASPRCEHPWWLDVMHKGRRYRMPVDDFAFARGATASVASKQEAEKAWEPKFIAEIASGKDPRILPGRDTVAGKPATVADLLTLYRQRHVEVERLKSRHTALSQLRILTAELGSCRRGLSNVLRRSKISRRDVPSARLRRPIGTWRDSVTFAIGRSDAICSARLRSIGEDSESSPKTNGAAIDESVKRRNSSCSTRASG